MAGVIGAGRSSSRLIEPSACRGGVVAAEVAAARSIRLIIAMIRALPQPRGLLEHRAHLDVVSLAARAGGGNQPLQSWTERTAGGSDANVCRDVVVAESGRQSRLSRRARRGRLVRTVSRSDCVSLSRMWPACTTVHLRDLLRTADRVEQRQLVEIAVNRWYSTNASAIGPASSGRRKQNTRSHGTKTSSNTVNVSSILCFDDTGCSHG